MSLSIIVTMMTSLAFGTGINARAAEIDENIVFENSIENEYQESASNDLPEPIISSEDADFFITADSDSEDSESEALPADDYSTPDSDTDNNLLKPEEGPVDNTEADSDNNIANGISFEVTDITDYKRDTANTLLETPESLEPTEEIIEEIIEEVEPETLQVYDLPDEEELFAQYVDREFGIDYYEPEEASTANARRGAPAKNYLNANEKIFYEKALELIEGVAAGTISSTGINYTPEELGLTSLSRKEVPSLFDYVNDGSGWNYVINTAKRDQAMQDIQNQLSINGTKVLNALCSDHPALLYWFGRSYQIGISSFSSNTNGNSVVWTSETTGTVDGVVEVRQFRIYLSVAFSYAVFEEGSTSSYYPSQADTAKTSATSTAVANAQAIAASYASLGNYEKLLAFKEKICSMVTYNQTAAINSVDSMGSNPWELIYVFDNDPNTNVVCEGYSKAFQYLCDISTFTNDTEVISVTGTMDGGPHEWNIVQFGGKNYLIDVTNCDTDRISGGHTGLFMKGYKSGSVSDGYVVTRDYVDYGDGWYAEESDIDYEYNKDTLSLYAGHLGDLTLSSTDYVPEASTSIHYTISFNANGGTGTMSDLTRCEEDVEYSLPACTFTRSGYTFSGWNTNAEGTGADYPDGASVRNLTTIDGTTVVLHAKWDLIPIVITHHPEGVNAREGEQISFSVTATGNDLSYQWLYKKNSSTTWTNFSGATNATLKKKMLKSWNGWNVKCVVTDGYGNSIDSNIALISLISGPTISSHPQSVSAIEGTSIIFNVVATGENLTYQWMYQKRNSSTWENFSGGTNATLKKKMMSGWNGWKIKCVVTDSNGYSSESNIASISLISGPTITSHPQSVSAIAGTTIVFNVVATGEALTYQWMYQKRNSSSWEYFSGGTSATLKKKMMSGWDNWKIKCVVTDANGNYAESNIATISLLHELTISSHPQSISATAGSYIAFNVVATGDSISYQWMYQKRNSTSWENFGGGTSATLKKKMLSSWNGWKVKCVVTDGYGNSINSNVATISLIAGPTISSHPQSLSATEGTSISFSVVATGNNLTYQWMYQKKNSTSWVSFSGGTSATLKKKMLSSWNGWKIKCVVTDINGNSIDSNVATISLITGPTISSHPQSISATAGTSIIFNVVATGDSLSYQWMYLKKNSASWENFSGGTTATLKKKMMSGWNGWKVKCVVTDGSGNSAESNAATITLLTQ